MSRFGLIMKHNVGHIEGESNSLQRVGLFYFHKFNSFASTTTSRVHLHVRGFDRVIHV
jgi:hypothetical protein